METVSQMLIGGPRLSGSSTGSQVRVKSINAIPQRDREYLGILQKVAQFRCFITITTFSSEAKPGLATKNSESNQMRAALETSLGSTPPLTMRG
jgi:hypothetical protein